jgi:hypothetical protein
MKKLLKRKHIFYDFKKGFLTEEIKKFLKGAKGINLMNKVLNIYKYY